MNKNELDTWIKKNKKTRSMYTPHIDEIRYLLENDISLDSINDFIFEKYGYKGSKPTLHTFIQRHIKKASKLLSNEKSYNDDSAQKKEDFSCVQPEIKKAIDSKRTNGRRHTVETSKRQMANNEKVTK